MNLIEFEKRFPKGTLIGTNITPDHYLKFYDNGAEVGVWRYNRRTTAAAGEVLGEEQAAAARHYFGRQR